MYQSCRGLRQSALSAKSCAIAPERRQVLVYRCSRKRMTFRRVYSLQARDGRKNWRAPVKPPRQRSGVETDYRPRHGHRENKVRQFVNKRRRLEMVGTINAVMLFTSQWVSSQ